MNVDLEELKYRRLRLMTECQEYMASVNNQKSHPTPSLPVGQIAGRSAKQVLSFHSRELDLYQNRIAGKDNFL